MGDCRGRCRGGLWGEMVGGRFSSKASLSTPHALVFSTVGLSCFVFAAYPFKIKCQWNSKS